MNITILTVDVEWDALADGGRHVVGGDAHVGAHHLPSDSVQAQRLAVVRVHFCATVANANDTELYIITAEYGRERER